MSAPVEGLEIGVFCDTCSSQEMPMFNSSFFFFFFFLNCY